MPKVKSRLSKDLGLTIQELSRQIGVSEFSVLSWRKKGLIPYLRIGGVCRYDLDKVVAALKRTERYDKSVP